jgi:hypothetical protein
MPDRAVALECKRVRVRAGAEGAQKVNRLEDVRDAPEQVNGLCRIGFSRTYLMVVAIVHDLSDPEYNFVSRGLREDTFTRVIRATEELPLDPQAGILYVEVAQPLPITRERSGVVCAGVLKPARVVEQAQELTARVERFLESRSGS